MYFESIQLSPSPFERILLPNKYLKKYCWEIFYFWKCLFKSFYAIFSQLSPSPFERMLLPNISFVEMSSIISSILSSSSSSRRLQMGLINVIQKKPEQLFFLQKPLFNVQLQLLLLRRFFIGWANMTCLQNRGNPMDQSLSGPIHPRFCFGVFV